jgi:hypothetical protein
MHWSTMGIIDEAGMADTLSLDRAVAFIVERGGSFRLVDDDQTCRDRCRWILRDIQASMTRSG